MGSASPFPHFYIMSIASTVAATAAKATVPLITKIIQIGGNIKYIISHLMHGDVIEQEYKPDWYNWWQD